MCENDRRSGALWEGSDVHGVRFTNGDSNLRVTFWPALARAMVDETRRASDAEEDD